MYTTMHDGVELMQHASNLPYRSSVAAVLYSVFSDCQGPGTSEGERGDEWGIEVAVGSVPSRLVQGTQPFEAPSAACYQ